MDDKSKLEVVIANGGADSDKGLALIIAVMIISVMVIFTADLILNSQVSLESAVGNRDRIKAEYIAKSGLNMAHFLIAVDTVVDQVKQSMLQTPPSDGPSDPWTMLNGLPIGGETSELLAEVTQSFGLNDLQDEEVVGQLRDLEGSFVIDVQDEGNKINVNYAAQGRGNEVRSMLTALMSCPAEESFLSQKKQKADELFYRIKDWIDDDKKAVSQSGFNDENDPYRRLVPPYFAKNAPMDTVSELMLIAGWDQDIQLVFAPYLTVYPVQTDPKQKPKLNLNTLPKAVISCFFPKADTDCGTKYSEALKSRGEDKQDLVSDAKDVQQVLKSVFCATSKESKKKSSWFTNQSNVFRVKVTGQVGSYAKSIESVIYRSDQKPKKKSKAKKEEKIQFLYWKSN